MSELPLDALGPAAAELVGRDVKSRQVTRIVRDGEVVALLIPAGLAEEIEDAVDIADIEDARTEGGDAVPWEQLREA